MAIRTVVDSTDAADTAAGITWHYLAALVTHLAQVFVRRQFK